ncbi:uncharacterized protein LOC143040346 [Oratosquilla oratoria]|uniref:uncharacterized protein LOC143040346 n=1 Tax=Oratosquilla oratoria TaxID=337810 RepID=UPI003F763EF8
MWISLSRTGSVNRRHAFEVHQKNELEDVRHLSSSSASSNWRKNNGLRRANSNIETNPSTYRSHWDHASRSGRLSFLGSPASSGETSRRKVPIPFILGRKSSVNSNSPLGTKCGAMTNNTEDPLTSTAPSSNLHDVGDFDRSSLRRRSSKALRRLMVLIKTADQANEEKEKEKSEDFSPEQQNASTGSESGSGSSIVPSRPGNERVHCCTQELRESMPSSLPLRLVQESQEDPPFEEVSLDEFETEINGNVNPDSQWNPNRKIFSNSQRNASENILASQWNANGKVYDSQWNGNGEVPNSCWNANDNISENQQNVNDKILDSRWNTDSNIPDGQCDTNEISDSQWNINGSKIPDGQWNANEEISDSQWITNETISNSQWNENGKTHDDQWNANDETLDSQKNDDKKVSESQWNANEMPDSPWNANGKTSGYQWNTNEDSLGSQWDTNKNIPDSQWNPNVKTHANQLKTNEKIFSSSQWNPWKGNGETDLDDWDDSVVSFGNSVESTTSYLKSMVKDESERSPKPPPSPETQPSPNVDYHGVEWCPQDDHEQEFSSTTFRCSPVNLENNIDISTCPFQNAFTPFEHILKATDHNKDTLRSLSPFFDPKDPTSISENNVSSTDLAALSWSSISLMSKDDVFKESGNDCFEMKDGWEKDDFGSAENESFLACFYQGQIEEESSDEDKLPDPFKDGQTYLRRVKENQSTQNTSKEDITTDWWLKDDFQEDSDETGNQQQPWVTFENDPLDISNGSLPKTCADLMDPVCTCGAIYRRLKVDQGGKDSTVAPARGLLCHHNSMSNLIDTSKRKRSSTTDSVQPPSSTRRLIRTYSQRGRVAGQRVINKISRRLYPEEYNKLREPITSRAVLTMLDGPAMNNQHRTPSTDTLLAASLSNKARDLPGQDHRRNPSSSSKESYPGENGNVPCDDNDSPAKFSVTATPSTTSTSCQRSRSNRYLKFTRLPLRRTISFGNSKGQNLRSPQPSAVETSAPAPWNFSRNSSFWKALQALQIPSLSKTFRRGSSKTDSMSPQTSSSTPRSPVFHTYVRGLSGLPVRVTTSTCSTGTISKGASPAALYWSRPTTPVKVHVVSPSSSSTPRAPRLPRRGMKSPT